LIEIITGQHPWPDLTPMDVYRTVVIAKKSHPIPEETPEQLKPIIKVSLSFESAERPTFVQVYSLLNAIDQTKLIEKRFPIGGKSATSNSASNLDNVYSSVPNKVNVPNKAKAMELPILNEPKKGKKKK